MAKSDRLLEPDSTEFQRALAVPDLWRRDPALRVLVQALGGIDVVFRRDPAQARDWYTLGVEITRRLAAVEPDNTLYLRDLSVFFGRLGDSYGQDNLAAARDWYAQGLEIRRRLAALAPDNTEYLRNLSISLWNMGDAERTIVPEDALRWYTQAAEIGERLVAMQPHNTRFLADLLFYCDRAATLNEAAHHESAYGWWERADQAAERRAALKPDDANFQCGLACTRARLGRTDEALAALDRSVDLGNTNADWAAQDLDLRSLWDLPAFAVILDRMRAAGK